MTDRILADISKNGRERIRISLTEFRGSRYTDLRIYTSGSDGAMVPTKQGVTLRAGMLRETIEALETAERELAGKAQEGARS